MPREPIIAAAARDKSAPDKDDDFDRGLRPQRIKDMVGQRDVIERLNIVVDAARKRGEPLGHILFDGPPGLGKTTFATCLPRELNVPLIMASGPAIKAPKDLLPFLTNMEERAVFFIDEIHRLPKAVEEYLYTAMEDFRLDIILGEGVNARTINMRIKPFTLIGATTRAGMLSAPLRDRFATREHLGFYSLPELTEIVRRSGKKLNVKLHEDAAVEIARRSRDTPRIANNRLRWVRDYADSRAGGEATLEVAQAALAMASVDTLGMDKQDRAYLTTLISAFGGGPAGLEAVAHTMNLAPDTLSDEVEPYLLRSELVVRTPRGRVVTAKAYEHLKMLPPAGGAERTLFG
jgi:Holliday junction DNA helicase RuvB